MTAIMMITMIIIITGEFIQAAGLFSLNGRSVQGLELGDCNDGSDSDHSTPVSTYRDSQRLNIS